MNTERLHDAISAVGPDFHGLSYRERLIVGAVLKHLSTPPADDVREALIEILDKSDPEGPVNSFPGHMEALRGVTADAILAAFKVRPRGTATETETEPAETYSVYGGQGLRRIASGLSREDAERVSRKFEIDCMNAGLTNPPGRIEREARS